MNSYLMKMVTFPLKTLMAKMIMAVKLTRVLGHGGNFAASELRRIASLAKDASDADIKKICSESFLDIDKDELKNYINSSGSAKSQLEYDIKLKFAIRYLSALLSRSFGTPVDFYVQMNLDGFVQYS